MCNSYYIDKIQQYDQKVYLDTCSIMDDSFPHFVCNIKDKFIELGKTIYIPCTVINELEKHLLSKNCEKATAAMDGINTIYSNRELFSISSSSMSQDESFADKEILAELLLNYTEQSQMLITQDKNLAASALTVNDMQAIYGKEIFVCRIDKNGELQNHIHIVKNNKVTEESSLKTLEANTTDHSMLNKKAVLYGIWGGFIGGCLFSNRNKIIKIVKQQISKCITYMH